MSFALSSTAAWYVVQTKPKKEADAFRNLCGLGHQCLFPKILDYRNWHGRSVEIKQPLFPGYLFVKLIPTQHYYTVKWTRGVARFVGWGDRPAAIADDVVELIRSRMDEQGRVRIEKNLGPGEQVRIKAGPLKDLVGVFETKISAQGRVRILLQLVSSQISVNMFESLVDRIR